MFLLRVFRKRISVDACFNPFVTARLILPRSFSRHYLPRVDLHETPFNELSHLDEKCSVCVETVCSFFRGNVRVTVASNWFF